MSGHERHLQIGLATHAAIVLPGLAVALAGSNPLALVAAGTALPFTLAGSVAPDVDHHSSKGYAVVVSYGPVVVAAVVAAVVFHHREGLITLCRALPVTASPEFLAGLGYAVVVRAVWRGTAKLIRTLRPPHRTVTHRLSTWVVVVLVGGSLLASAYASLGLGDVVPIACVHCGAFLAGVASHLYCDGIVKLPDLSGE
ncbi:hypothetical protein [Haloarcula sediminis]|uniref:hypothetical protein n=1 Tax=Haloarcula sediminis TaxID=3111777 RepID=UPI002D76A0C6|nr:hypothetical protein [Haloarcula sp. CK38]